MASSGAPRLAVALAEVGPPAAVFSLGVTRGPVVYVWMRADRVLYVGMSQTFRRPLALRQHNRLREIEEGDRVLMWTAPSDHEARRLERRLIRALDPELNVDRRPC